jgi:hypothetical protein
MKMSYVSQRQVGEEVYGYLKMGVQSDKQEDGQLPKHSGLKYGQKQSKDADYCSGSSA